MGGETRYTPDPVAQESAEEEASCDQRMSKAHEKVMTRVGGGWAGNGEEVAPSEIAIESPIIFTEEGEEEETHLTPSKQVKENTRREKEATKAVREMRDEGEDAMMTQGSQYEEDDAKRDDFEMDWDNVPEQGWHALTMEETDRAGYKGDMKKAEKAVEEAVKDEKVKDRKRKERYNTEGRTRAESKE